VDKKYFAVNKLCGEKYFIQCVTKGNSRIDYAVLWRCRMLTFCPLTLRRKKNVLAISQLLINHLSNLV